MRDVNANRRRPQGHTLAKKRLAGEERLLEENEALWRNACLLARDDNGDPL